ncbi:MAG TPA: ferritin-like domain-containing protein [Solirubrobacterales bacterium]|nr:ferritin-like domain-containing protein [Solirubrobacterales bacterium]
MNRAAPSRREALRAGAFAAGAIAAGGLVRPLQAAAQSTATETEDLRDFLAEAVAREQITALAYSQAGQAGGGALARELERTALERFREQTQAHVNALASALESIGYDAPDEPSDPEDDGVFDGVDGIDSDTATALGDLLATVGEPTDINGFLDLLIDLELDQIRFYHQRGPALDSEDLRTTCAEIAANEAQHLVVLRRATGAAPAAALAIEVAAPGGAETEGE